MSTVFYDGPSQLTGDPILLAMTGLKRPSNNKKTGPMLQTWIIPKNINPVKAIKDGKDESVCGDCKHRPSLGGACYVNVGQAPNQIWKSTKHYEIADPSIVKGKSIRFGAWGDPSAVPLHVWEGLMEAASSWTAYTHQWKSLDVKKWGWCMASVDTYAEQVEAKKAGWRTFRAILPGENTFSEKEIQCLADSAGLTCIKCKLCDGNGRSNKLKDIFIEVHGSKKKRAKEYM